MLASLLAVLAVPGEHLPMTYVTPTGSIVVVTKDKTTVLAEGNNPRLSADTTKLVFWAPLPDKTDQANIVLFDLASNQRKTLATGFVRNPAINPSGTQVSFSQAENGVWNLHSVDLFTGKDTLLSTRDGFWSDWVSDSLVQWTGLLQIFQVGLDAKEAAVRTKPLPAPLVPTWQDRVVSNPVTPGVFVVGYSVPTDTGVNHALALVDQNGFRPIPTPGFQATEPTWTRDGQGILFTATPIGKSESTVAIVAPDGSSFEKLFSGHSPSM